MTDMRDQPARIHISPDGLEGFWVYAGPTQVGRVFPVVVKDPDSQWFGRIPRTAARRFDRIDEALRHVLQPVLDDDAVDAIVDRLLDNIDTREERSLS